MSLAIVPGLSGVLSALHSEAEKLGHASAALARMRQVASADQELLREATVSRLTVDAVILIVDEATSSLDHETEQAMLSNLRPAHGRTDFVVRHASAADRRHAGSHRLYMTIIPTAERSALWPQR